MTKTLRLAFQTISACALVAVHATAGSITGPVDPVEISIVGTANDVTQATQSPLTAEVDSETGDFDSQIAPREGDVWELTELSISGNVDPTVTLSFTIVNTSTSPADLSVNAFVPISGVFGPLVSTFGEISFTATDTGGDGVTFSTTPAGSPTGDSIFTGSVDGVPELTIFGPPSSFSATTVTGSSLGNTGVAPEADTSIEIDIVGTLSPLDVLTVDATFTIEAIPEPTALGLASIAAVGLFGRRRR